MNVVKIIDAEAYLNEIKDFELKIKNKLAEIQQLRYLAVSLGGAPLGCDVPQVSKNNDRIGSAVAKIIDEENEVREDISRFIEMRRERIKTIEKLCGLHYDILHLHYVQYISLKKIAKEKNYAYSYVLELHKEAKEALQELLPPEIVK